MQPLPHQCDRCEYTVGAACDSSLRTKNKPARVLPARLSPVHVTSSLSRYIVVISASVADLERHPDAKRLHFLWRSRPGSLRLIYPIREIERCIQVGNKKLPLLIDA